MTTKAKVHIEPGWSFRREAGPYDPKTHLPRYDFEVVAPDADADADADAKRRVVDESHVMGHADNFFWIWDIKNNSTQDVFITLTKEGVQI